MFESAVLLCEDEVCRGKELPGHRLVVCPNFYRIVDVARERVGQLRPSGRWRIVCRRPGVESGPKQVARIRVTPRNESPKITTSHPTLLDTANCSSKCFSRRAEFKSDEFSSGHGFFILVTYVSPK